MSNRYAKEIETDVVVLGAGTAGIGAAVQAAREGNRVILIENTDRIGGIMQICQGMPLGCGYPCQKTVGGIFGELVDHLFAQDPPAAWIRLLPNLMYGWDVYYNQDIATAYLYQMLEDAGVQLILRAVTGEIEMDGSRITAIEYHDITGTNLVRAKIFIDCTGIGDVCKRAGVPFEVGDESGRQMAGTLTFIMSNVDTELAFPTEDKENHNFQATELVEQGLIPKYIQTVYYTRNANPGQVFFNWCMAHDVDGAEPESLLDGTRRARKYILALSQWLKKNVPAFKNAYLDGIGPMVGIRDGRRFEGMYYLTEQDLMEHRKFDDTGICCCDNVFDEASRGEDVESTHDSILTQDKKNTDYYRVPFGTLVPKRVENLMFAGKILSSDARAMTSARGMATCMIMGQATGSASTIAIRDGITVQEVDAKEVIASLQKAGVRGLGSERLI